MEQLYLVTKRGISKTEFKNKLGKEIKAKFRIPCTNIPRPYTFIVQGKT